MPHAVLDHRSRLMEYDDADLCDLQHVEAWSEMLAKSDPPITSTPITPFLDEHAFRSELHAECFSGLLLMTLS